MSSVLDQSITYKELLNWKIHWIYCELNTLLSEIEVYHFNGSLKPIEDFAQKAQTIIDSGLSIELWQIETMSSQDTYKFQKEVTTFESYKRVCAIHEDIKAHLQVQLTNYQKSITHRFNDLFITKLNRM